MKITVNKFKYFIIQAVFWLITFIYMNFTRIEYTDQCFRKLCLFTAVMSIVVLIVQIKYEGGIIRPFVIVLICFELFQIGLPILYGFDKNYTSWNMEFIDIKNRTESLIFTIHCIHAFALGGCLGLSDRGKKINVRSKYLKDSRLIRKIALFLSIVTGIVAIPLAGLIAILSMRYGYTYIKVDSMGINSGFTNMVRTVFPAAIFLLLIYSKSKLEKRVVLFFIILYSGLSMVAGGRTVGLSMLLTLIYYFYSSNEETTKKKKIGQYFFIVGAVCALLIILVLVRVMRMGQSMEGFNLITIIESVVEEMGFNFTSICFTKLYVPASTAYQVGKSYIYAIICLIPTSLDPTGMINVVKQMGPEQWLAAQLHGTYGVTFDYGVGYSVIAESFYNFGNFGFLIVLLQGYIIQKVLSIKFEGNNNFGMYIKVIMLWALTTYPRRSFYTLEKALEYNVLLIIIAILIVGRMLKRGK